MKNYFVRSISLIVFILPFSCQSAVKDDPALDLSRVNFSNTEVLPVSGEWEFYWGALLTPAELSERPRRSEPIVVGAWNRQFNYPSLGIATYRKRLILPERNTGLAVYFPIINASANVWINGKKLAEAGLVSSDRKHYKPQLSGILVEIPADTTQLEIVIEVANYTHFHGGITGQPLVGKISALLSSINRTQSIENFFAGSLMAMFIYQFILFYLFQRGQPYLWLSLICLGVALRAMVVHGGSFMLPNLFPNVSWEMWKKLEFFSVYAITSFFPLYIYHLFRESAPRWPIKMFVTISALLCIAVLTTAQYTYGRLLDVSHVTLLAAFLYAVYSVGRAWSRGSNDAKIILFGVLASFPFILVEILKNSLLFPLGIQWMYLVEMGVLVFLLFQVYLLAHHYARSFRNLESMNENLEKMVEERSAQLIVANQVKDRLLSVMSHDIKSPLNSLRGILHIYNQGAISAEDFKTYANRIEGDLTKTGLLVDNILYWTTGQLKGITVSLSQFNLKDLLSENIALLQTIMTNKGLTIENDLNEKDWVHFDRDILNLTLRNLISNAIKFSFEGGRITVRCEQSGGHMILRVSDCGLGMSPEKIASLQQAGTTQSSLGTAHEKGTGLGLSFCRDYLQQAGGQLKIESTLGEGSTFSIWIPKEEPDPEWSLPIDWEYNLIR